MYDILLVDNVDEKCVMKMIVNNNIGIDKMGEGVSYEDDFSI